MAFSHDDIYRFGDFVFDANRLALYFGGEILKVERKSLEVLAVLIARPRELVSTAEIIEQVWGDNAAGVGSVHLAQNIRKLRQALAARDGGADHIRNVKGLGYILDRDVEREGRERTPSAMRAASPEPDRNAVAFRSTADTELPPESDGRESSAGGTDFPANRTMIFAGTGVPRKLVFGGLAALVLLAVAGFAWQWLHGSGDEEEVRRVVQESQLYESLVLYRDPKGFREELLDKYWTAETDINSNFDRKRLRTGVRDLLEKGQYYGGETKCEQFEFQSVEVDAKRQMALAKTLEKWFIAVYRTDGGLEKNKYVGPYFVSYVLRKVDGRWLVDKSNTARANIPMPQLATLEALTEPKGGQQFFVKLTGAEIMPQTVFIRITGDGCPEQNPCIVANGALAKIGAVTDTSLDKVPLNLPSGRYALFVHNSENHPSNPLTLIVP